MTRPLPKIADRAAWQAQLDELRVKEKQHTRLADALAAERRRLPMVEVDPQTPVTGADGPVPLIDVFEGRSQLIAYYQMWHTGKPAAKQCVGCTFYLAHVNELSYLHSRDITFANFCEGPYPESARYRDFMGWTFPHYAVPAESVDRLVAGREFGMSVSYLRDGEDVYETYWTTDRGDEHVFLSYGLMDRTVYGRQEAQEDSPEGWPQHFANNGGQWSVDGRPAPQWARLEAGHSDDLG
ncbi:MAG: hypothetical protein JWN31_1395 [Frankiales bacterium]|nr:hypothetical protein [Frankiales bacterium]